MGARPKMRAQPSSSTDEGILLGIDRAADELASRVVHARLKEAKQPWEQGTLAAIFGRPKRPWDRAVGMHAIGLSDHIQQVDNPREVPKPIQQSSIAKNRIRTSRIIADDEDVRRAVLSRYKTMVLVDITATRLGLSLTSVAGTPCSDDELSQVFMDVFATKSTGTLLKRSNSLWRFHCWLVRQNLGSPFVQSESTLYSYMCFLRSNQAGFTTPSQLIEALRFSDALLGFQQISLADILSSRVLGSAHATYMGKRDRRPAQTLSVL